MSRAASNSAPNSDAQPSDVVLTSDIVLTRLISYLQLAGVAIDDALLFRLTDIVREGCEAKVPALFDWSLATLNGSVRDLLPTVSPPMPPLQRGHIGYDTHQRRRRSPRIDGEVSR